jgi:DNA replication protein DnaC
MDIIIAQIKQITNSYLIKNISTNDRIIDSAIVLIALAIFDIIFNYIKNNYNNLIFMKNIIINNEPWNFDSSFVTFDIIDNVCKYKYIVILENNMFRGVLSDDKINNQIETLDMRGITNDAYKYDVLIKLWINKFSNYKILLNLSGSTLFYICNESNSLKNNKDKDSKDTNFMPLWCYKENNKYQFIYYYNNNLYSNNVNELNKFVEHFLNFINSLTINTQYKHKLTINSINTATYSSHNNNDLLLNSYINTKKTFDTLYIDNKHEIIDLIDKFENNKMYPPAYHLDNKLGLLLYGPSGTGKSGFVTCLANKLQRSILLIDSFNHSKNLILNTINKYKKTHIIVLDEFDKLLENIGKYDEVNFSSLFSAISSEEKEKIIKNITTTNKPSEITDIVFLMKLLDSFGDDSDRIIVATTNHPEKIPSLLIRPGRFDKIVCMSYCSFNMFVDIARGSYDDIDKLLENENIKNKIIDIIKLNITPLILINTCVTTKTFDDVLNKLSNMKQKHYENNIKDYDEYN